VDGEVVTAATLKVEAEKVAVKWIGDETNEDMVVVYTLDGSEDVFKATSMADESLDDADFWTIGDEEAIDVPVPATIKAAVAAATPMGDITWSDMVTLTVFTAADMPAKPTFEPAAGEVAFGTMVELACETEDATIYFTTDGTEPTAESEEYSWFSEILITKAMTVKAIAVLNGVSSEVAEAAYTAAPVENARLALSPMKEDSVGKNVSTAVSFTDGTPESEGWMQQFPATVYYTVDGTTVPSKAAYEAQADKANGAIKMMAVKWEEQWGSYGPVSDAEGNFLSLTFTEATRLKAIGYLMEGDEVLVTTALLDTMLQIKAEAKPTFSIADYTKVAVGDKLVIKNPNYYEAFDMEMPEWPEDYFTNEESAAAYDAAMGAYDEALNAYQESIADIPQTTMYFSFDGTKPTLNNRYADENESVFSTEAGRNVEITFGQDETGYYAYVPEILGYNSNADTIRLAADGHLSVQVLCITTETEAGGDEPMPLSAKWGRPGAVSFNYGSDFVTATYTLKDNLVVEAPAFNPAAGEVEKGTKLELTCATEGAKIYYTVDGAEPTAESTLYAEAIEINEAMTVKAIAIRGDFKSEVKEAAYTIMVVAKPTFKPAAGAVKKGTKVELACATEGAKIYYTVDGAEPTAESTLYAEAIEINEAMTIKAIAIKGNTKSEVAEAAYTIDKTANEDLELAGVSVYPNPSNGLFNIELPVAATMEVFMSNGMLYQRVKAMAGVATLNIERSGIYILRITGEGRTTVKRIIVR
ncbi:MAG: chitobiase/beta-hexosaminidase C-terminal domain-containing protein, partial [Bacteroidales bacterium]|nr:chitobiase/beta-hexosaminidase C-terminal domain-containing protein [Bacteroidales bacterium]